MTSTYKVNAKGILLNFIGSFLAHGLYFATSMMLFDLSFEPEDRFTTLTRFLYRMVSFGIPMSVMTTRVNIVFTDDAVKLRSLFPLDHHTTLYDKVVFSERVTTTWFRRFISGGDQLKLSFYNNGVDKKLKHSFIPLRGIENPDAVVNELISRVPALQTMASSTSDHS